MDKELITDKFTGIRNVTTTTLVGPSEVRDPNMNNLTLYVGDLNPEVSELLFNSTFCAHGRVRLVNVCLDETTNISLGYANIEFETSGKAEKGMEAVSYSYINGKPCRIMRYMEDSTRLKLVKENLFIKNIAPEINSKSIHQEFSTFGEVISCKVSLGEHGFSKGYGFVEFLNVTHADRALELINGLKICNKVIMLNKFIHKSERMDGTSINPHEYTNLFVKNFGKDWTEDDLKKTFEKVG
ncbi:Polyadenylate-binding protein, cytoplasmic and nuclear [Thelohanellus kitauei]|uniref:Polyadenylate-binding protein, cytoplasmic and nuclear n=1 Tax=Thelohanellus kitauei TaxID=669202 RepID=A0A0C2N4Q8_THEKT|nr:Polyadenylate-binding protein, cytoplasmic and nuclear [Thelohanellus kitauei]